MSSCRRSPVVGLALVFVVTAGVAAQQPSPKDAGGDVDTRERNLRAYTELLRSDVRTHKIALITQVMGFTEAEDAAFWPVYREYELELSRLYDERIRLFEMYSSLYTKLTDAAANELMVKALNLETRRAALKQKFYDKLKTVVSPLTAARALQVENQIQLLVDLQVAAALPVAR